MRSWIVKGLVVPAVLGAVGRGHTHKFSMTQATGLAAGVAETRTFRGASLPYVGRVVEAFAAVTPAWLEAEFAAGRTHLAEILRGRPVLSGPVCGSWVDVEKVYRRVASAAERGGQKVPVVRVVKS